MNLNKFIFELIFRILQFYNLLFYLLTLNDSPFAVI